MSRATDHGFPFDHRVYPGGDLLGFLAEQRELDQARDDLPTVPREEKAEERG